jgi:IclR family mhp operon transcriptional activator
VIESVAKAFKMLALVNERPGSTLSQLAAAANYPRGTAFRILNTLCSLSLVRQCNKPAAYYVTSNALSLTRGVHAQQVTWEIITESLGAVSDAPVWPVVFTVPKGDWMEVIFSNCDENPRALKKPKCGERLPIALSATGLVYLTACERARSNQQGQSLRGSVSHELRLQISRAGYYINDRTQTAESVIAVPVIVQGTPIGALGMRFITSAVKASEVRDHLLPDLCALRDKVVRKAEQQSRYIS